MEDPPILRRYTSLASVLYLLSEKKITLLDPISWDDKNDVYYMQKYKEKKKLKTLLALCFTETHETYHHWRVFTEGSSGVRIDFNKDKLLQHFDGSFCKGKMEYELVKEQQRRAKGNQLKIQDLPFIKRWSFKPEAEYRIIYESQDEEKKSLDVPINLSCIEMIELSPWMPENLVKATKEALKKVDGCQRIKIRGSTVVGHKKWQSFADNAI